MIEKGLWWSYSFERILEDFLTGVDSETVDCLRLRDFFFMTGELQSIIKFLDLSDYHKHRIQKYKNFNSKTQNSKFTLPSDLFDFWEL